MSQSLFPIILDVYKQAALISFGMVGCEIVIKILVNAFRGKGIMI